MASDIYRIDGHKLMYHVDRVNDWLANKPIYPIYMEVSPSGACNHRCVYCGPDFMGYQKRFLQTDVFKDRLAELGELGLKSVMYAGEGEPFLHKDLGELVCHTSNCGIDVAITTNGTLLQTQSLEQVLAATEWIKVSIDAGTANTYARIHRTREDDFDRVIANMTEAARLRDKQGYRCVLGMQLVLLPENCREAVPLAELAADIGMDYLVVKPYSQHPLSKTQQYRDIKYDSYLHLAEELEKFNTDGFSVIFRIRTMHKWDAAEHRYERCQALPFWSYIDAGGNVWGCSVYLGDERFLYGNIYEESFEQIWQGPKRCQSLGWVEEELDVSGCRVNCRMDEINRYLWELRHPPAHVNFI